MKVRLVLLVVLTLTAGRTAAAAEAATVDRRAAVRHALAWLVQATERKAWDHVEAGNANAVVMRDVVTLMTAWLLEVNPDFLEFDKVRRRFRDQADRLAGRAYNPVEGIFANWLAGFTALYVYERSLRDGQTHPALDRIARGFVERQNIEGGWGHGKGNLLSWYPSTLIATSNLALLALGMAARQKTPVVKEVDYQQAVSKGLKLLRDVQGPHGGMPYGGRHYRKGFEAARTASMLLALSALRQTDSDLFRRAATYALLNVEKVPNGHGGSPIPMALGALACSMLSEEAWRRYDAQVLVRVRKAQRKDGSFSEEAFDKSPPSPVEADAKDSKLFETAYTTAFFAIGLAADQTKVARQLRLSTPFQPLPPEDERPCGKLPAPAWQFDVDNVVALEANAKVVVVLQKDGTLTFLAADSGQLLGKVRLRVKVEQLPRVSLKLRASKALVLVRSGIPRLSCYDAKQDKPEWQAEVAGKVCAWWSDEERVSVVTLGGELVILAVSTGRIMHHFRVGEVVANLDLQPLSGERYAFVSESHLRVYDGEGKVIWEDQNREERGLTPSAFGALAAWGDRLYLGVSDGRVECRKQQTGRVVWQVPLQSYIERVYVTGTKPECVLVVGQDGLVYSLREGKVAWRMNVSRGIERNGNPVYRLTTAGLVVAQRQHGCIKLVDAESGRVKNLAPHAANWSATDRHLILWSGSRLCAYPLR